MLEYVLVFGLAVAAPSGFPVAHQPTEPPRPSRSAQVQSKQQQRPTATPQSQRHHVAPVPDAAIEVHSDGGSATLEALVVVAAAVVLLGLVLLGSVSTVGRAIVHAVQAAAGKATKFIAKVEIRGRLGD